MSAASLEGRGVIVLGVASDIGAAAARALAARGATLVLGDRDLAAAEALADALAGSVRCLPVACDVTREEEVEALVATAARETERLHGLVSLTAATGDRHPGSQTVTGMEVAAWDHVFAVNLRGPMLAAKHAIPHMAAGGGGSIVHISSTAAILSLGSLPAYAASKAGMHALTLSIATAHGHERIRCNTVAPGFVRTATTSKMTDQFFELAQHHNLLPFIGEPDDLGLPIAFLISDEARYLTGQLIAVDGGQTCHLPIFDDIKRGASGPAEHKTERQA